MLIAFEVHSAQLAAPSGRSYGNASTTNGSALTLTSLEFRVSGNMNMAYLSGARCRH